MCEGENNMRCYLRFPVALLVMGFTIVLVANSSALAKPRTCTQRTVLGTYAIGVQGITLIPIPGSTQPVAAPFSSLMIASFDSTGTMSGFGYGAFNGIVSSSPATGTIQVNPDCTAVVNTSAGTVSYDVILDNGDELWAVMKQFPIGSPVLQGRAKRISRQPNSILPARCAASDVRGTYAIRYEGTYLVSKPGITTPLPLPAIITGIVTVDGQGDVSGGGTSSLAGSAADFDVVGKINMESDCTAVTQLNVTSAGLVDTGRAWMVVLNNGDEIWMIQTDSDVANPIIAGTWKRISHGGSIARHGDEIK
jgi:hypothetical protein